MKSIVLNYDPRPLIPELPPLEVPPYNPEHTPPEVVPGPENDPLTYPQETPPMEPNPETAPLPKLYY